MDKFMELSDEKLVLKAQSGDESAEEEVIERYKVLVKSKAKIYYIVGADKEDVVQEGMIGLYKAIRSFDEKRASFSTYASKCVNAQLINAIKKANRMKNSPLNQSVSIDAENKEGNKLFSPEANFAGENNPEQLLLAKELMEYASSEDNQIFSSFERQVWNLVIQGKSYDEIGKELGKTQKSIENAVQRIRQKFYKLLYE